MKALFVTTVPETMRAFLLPFSDMLKKAGWEVHAAASGIDKEGELLESFDELHNISFSRVFPKALLLSPITVLQTLSLQIKERFSIVHVHTPIASFITRLSLSLLGKRRPVIIYTVHGFHFHPLGGRLSNKLFFFAERFAARFTDFMVVINEEDYSISLKESFPVRKAVLHIPGVGVDTSYFNPSRVEKSEIDCFRKRHGISEFGKVFVMVAEFNKGKKHDVALKAMKLLEQRDVVMIFAGEGKLRQRHESLAAKMGLLGKVRFIGFEKNMPVLLAASDCMVLPSMREGLPRSVMEAMAMGKPVIGSDIRGIRDLLKDGAGLLVPPNDYVALAEAMTRIIEEPEKAAEMGKIGRKRIEEKYDISMIMEQLISLYRKAAELAVTSSGKEAKRSGKKKPYEQIAKRTFDVVASSTALLALSPLLTLIYALVGIRLGASAIFRQERPGLNGKPFTIYKFRTMKDLCDSEGNLLPDEERITRLGYFLRRTSLDELPELFNVLKGDMSIVGPRPLLMEYLPLYTDEQMRRHEVKPGITGWAQVNGRNLLDWEKKFELDVWYVDNWSLWLDFKIILKTVMIIFRRVGISKFGKATVPRFTGKGGNAK
jgi:lipopolysaccharide/colanic/teichoic acid biosynthesis glycosyltransferase/glycosyltransferase involved in cell wall biosynthesis